MGAQQLLVADDVGFVKAVRFSPDAPEAGSPAVVARWGEAREGGGVLCCSAEAAGEGFQGVALARASGHVELWDSAGASAAHRFKPREGAPGAGAASRALSRCVYLAWLPRSDVGAAPPLRLLSAFRDGLVCVHDITSPGAGVTGHPNPVPGWQCQLALSFSVLGAPSGSAQSVVADEKRLFLECAEVARGGAALAVGGKGLELSVWDLESASCVWRARNPKPDSLGLVEQKWVTSLCHVSASSAAQKALVAVGTSSGRIHLFEAGGQQRRPVASWQAGESPVNRLLAPLGSSSAAPDAACDVIFSCRDGLLGHADVRRGRLLGKFKGGSGGAVAALSLLPHSPTPLLISCGLDRFLRFHSFGTRELLGEVYLKQAGTCLALSAVPPAADDRSDDAEAAAQPASAGEAQCAGGPSARGEGGAGVEGEELGAEEESMEQGRRARMDKGRSGRGAALHSVVGTRDRGGGKRLHGHKDGRAVGGGKKRAL